jgi:CO/xanthine dehydrogenase Mo-binding subunit
MSDHFLPDPGESDWSTTGAPNGTVSRRAFLKGTGVLVVSVSMGELPIAEAAGQATAPTGPTAATAQEFNPAVAGPDPRRLDTWLAIGEDGNVTFFTGKNDNGQGLATAFKQLVADELDVALDRITIVMGDTERTPDQRGASASDGVQGGGPALRMACAEARRVLLEQAAQRLGVQIDQLVVRDGVISPRDDSARALSYGELVGGRQFNVALKWNGQLGVGLTVAGRAEPKKPEQLRVVGQPVPREDIPPIVFGRPHYSVDVNVPGMVHGRSIKPPVAGAKVIRVDTASVKDIPGLIGVVTKGDYVGVVCEREEAAIKAAQRLRVEWSNPGPVFPTDSNGLFEYMRTAPHRVEQVGENVGNVDDALARARRVLEMEYRWPFQSHSSFGPGCAVADWRDGRLTMYSGTQKPFAMRRGLARFLDISRENVRCVWLPGPGSYGRNDAGDVGFEAALLAKEVGRPVRLQWTRHEGIAWDPKGPPVLVRVRAGLDEASRVIAYSYEWKGPSVRGDVHWEEEDPAHTLVGQLLGVGKDRQQQNGGGGAGPYSFPSKRTVVRIMDPFLLMASPLRGAHLRAPGGPPSTFAAESSIDELAAAAGADPVQFRLAYLKMPRQRAVIEAAAQLAGWDTRRSPKPTASQGRSGRATGRGLACATGFGTTVAVVAEVEVDLNTGRVRVKRFACAADAGLIVNADGARNAVQGALLHTTSRTLYEEVKFDRTKVTSADWRTYPIATMADAPDQIDIVFLNPEQRESAGLGEPPCAPVPAAIANAIFDATGARVRQVPFTPARVKAALEAREQRAG